MARGQNCNGSASGGKSCKANACAKFHKRSGRSCFFPDTSGGCGRLVDTGNGAVQASPTRWPGFSNKGSQHETGFEKMFGTDARIQPDSFALSGRCGLPPKKLDRFWTINHIASLNPTNWPQRSSPEVTRRSRKAPLVFSGDI